ncbi:dihydroorotase [Galbibacter sp.]|uniref:dihydroorotase n=1 Tax=Galbibacter sp. TaxID=2918471 RepID=UPI003A93F09D
MNILIKSAKIIAPKKSYNQQTKDILIIDGTITKIEDQIETSEQVTEISLDNLHVSDGWFDSSVCFGEPGYEDRETIENGLDTAAFSGYTAVAVNPNTHPVADTNADIGFIKSKGASKAASLYPIAALTTKSDGVDLAELFDMKNAGAVAFGDYQKPIANPNLLKIALQYTQNFNGLVLSFPMENKVIGKGVVNEGVLSTRLGLKGIPALSEELQIVRDLFILEYTGGKLHIPTISTKLSVDLIKKAKEKGLDVSCSVALANLVLNENELEDFDTNYKVLPPLRTEEDRKALVEGVKKGVIDFVTSDHNPIDIENKNIEFDHALFGTIGLEASFGLLLQQFPLETVIKTLTSGKERFGITDTSIEVGNKANITLFDPEPNYKFDKSDILSLSTNCAFTGKEIKGKVYGVISNNLIQLKTL